MTELRPRNHRVFPGFPVQDTFLGKLERQSCDRPTNLTAAAASVSAEQSAEWISWADQLISELLLLLLWGLVSHSFDIIISETLSLKWNHVISVLDTPCSVVQESNTAKNMRTPWRSSSELRSVDLSCAASSCYELGSSPGFNTTARCLFIKCIFYYIVTEPSGVIYLEEQHLKHFCQRLNYIVKYTHLPASIRQQVPDTLLVVLFVLWWHLNECECQFTIVSAALFTSSGRITIRKWGRGRG